MSTWFTNRDDLNSFLGFRYVPRKAIRLAAPILESATTRPNPEGDPVLECSKSLRRTFERCVDRYDRTVTHIVPLSGGIDSRLILGGLLENVGRDRILTMTFGTPGTADFDIGQQVAKVAGVDNRTIDMRPDVFPWSEAQMVKIAGSYEYPTHLFRAVSAFQYAFDDIEVDHPVYWSGFMGDPLAGARLPKTPSATWDDALDYFISKNLVFPHLTEDDFDPTEVLPDGPAVERATLSYDDQLDFGIRQKYFIEGPATMNGSFVTPFLESPWLPFILNRPWTERYGRRLVRQSAVHLYPTLFSLPTETNAGLPIGCSRYHRKIRSLTKSALNRISKMLGAQDPLWSTNHLDWDLELHRSDDFRKFIDSQLADLQERDCVTWVDIDRIWRDQLSGSLSFCGAEIHQLTSLELFLKAQDRHQG